MRIFPHHAVAIVVTFSLTLLWSCGRGRGDVPVPRPEAWPRIELPTPDYQPTKLGDVEFLLNSSATLTTKERGADSTDADDSDIWFDVTYPKIPGATLYLSLSALNDTTGLRKAIANRRQRMELNSGGALTEIMPVSSAGGWVGEVALTRSSVATPIYVIAHDGSSRLLSGALYLNYPTDTSADSIAPIVRAVSSDMVAMLESLKNL